MWWNSVKGIFASRLFVSIMALSNEANQRGLRDFLQLYNTITGFCFDKCVSNFNDRQSTQNENICIDVCTDNYIQFNQRLMFNFMDHQERRKRELESAAAELAAKETSAAQMAATEVTAPASNDNEIPSTHQNETVAPGSVSSNPDIASTSSES